MATPPFNPFQCPHNSILMASQHYNDTIPLHSLQSSAAAGCTLCPILLAAIHPLLTDPSFSKSAIVHIGAGFAAGLRLRVTWMRPEGKEESSAEVELFGDEEFGDGFIPTSRVTSTNTADETAFRRLEEWARTCIMSHRLLCMTMSPSPNLLPHRILSLSSEAVSTPTSTSAPRVFLKEHSLGEMGNYACLSHSWGGHQPLRTLTATLEAHKKDIAWESLPKTFQDAVVVALRLNLQYIWIDSLCIIQDSDEDWSVESALMADIYRNATITLSAAASKGPNDGLFVSVPVENRAVKIEPAFVMSQQPYPNFYTRHRIDHHRRNQPLLSRGWVHQERLLSPRVIHFGAFELMWECMQSTSCECGATPGRLSWFNEKRDFHPAALSLLPIPFTAFTWRKVVQDFCGLTLSFPEDAFPAVSGAAKIVGQTLKKRAVRSNYIAGLWECWFVEDCLWSMSKPAKRPDVWRAPTFSWASVVASSASRLVFRSTQLFESVWTKDETEIDPKAMSVYTTLAGYERTLDGRDDMGRICSASVVLAGPLRRARLKRGDLVLEAERISGWPDFNPDYDFSVPGRYQIASDATLWCLQLASLRVPRDDPRHEYLWFLVLREVEIEQDGMAVYERVGLLRYRENFDKERPVERWFHAEKQGAEAVIKIL